MDSQLLQDSWKMLYIAVEVHNYVDDERCYNETSSNSSNSTLSVSESPCSSTGSLNVASEQTDAVTVAEEDTTYIKILTNSIRSCISNFINWKPIQIFKKWFEKTILKRTEECPPSQTNKLAEEDEGIFTTPNGDDHYNDSTSPMIESLGSPVRPFTGSAEPDDDDVVGSLKQEIQEMLKAQQLSLDLAFIERKRKHEEQMRENWSTFRDVMEVKARLENEEFMKWTSSPD